MPATAVLFGAFLFLPCSGPASGGTPPSGAPDLLSLDASPDSAMAMALGRIEGEPLSLEQAVESAMEGSTAARDAEAALGAARSSVGKEKGAFDPQIQGEASKSGNDSPTTSPFSGASVLKLRQTAVSAGVSIRLPIGTELGAALNATRQESNSAYANLVPQYNAFGQLQIRQPLLKGFGPSARSSLSSAERDYEAARASYEDARLGIRADVETAYWDLYAAERDLSVQRLIRDRAAALLSEVQLRAKAGLVGPNQVANARVFLAEQEQAVLDREESLDAASDRMATLLGRRPASGFIRFRPIDEPPQEFIVESADSLVARSHRNNRQLAALKLGVEAARARARGARWDALPSLDLFGTLGGNGLSGTGRDVVFGQDTLRTKINGGFSDTWRQVRRRDYPTWSAGLRFTVPIGTRAGRGERDRLRAEAARAQERYEAARRSLEERARAAQRELAVGARRVALSKDGVDASLEQVRVGVLEYRSGRTTAFELVRLGADLAAAQQRYSQALVRAARASAELRRLTAESYPASADPH